MDPKIWLALVAVLGFSCLLRIPIANIPLERDEGEYAYIGQRLLQGDIPYKTSFDQKPPATFLAYALIQRMVGTSPSALHWGAQIYTLLTLVVIFCLGAKLFAPIAGVLAAFFAALMLPDRAFTGNAANTETFMILPMMAAFWAALISKERQAWRWSLISGMLLGISCLFKQVAALNGVFLVLFFCMSGEKRAQLALSFIAGMLVPFSVTMGYFAMAGAFNEFFDAVVGHNIRYASQMPGKMYLEMFWRSFRPQCVAFVPLFVLLIFALRRARYENSVRLLTGWLLFSFFGVAIGGYFREHYFIHLIPGIALLAAGELAASFNFCNSTRAAVACLLVAMGTAIWAVSRNVWYYNLGDPNQKARKIYGHNPFPESLPVGRYIAAHSTPSDKIFVFGSEPQILYYAERASASRYIFMYPLMGEFVDSRARQHQLVGELIRSPKFIVTVFVPASFAVKSGILPIFEYMQNLLRGSYKLNAFVPWESDGTHRLVFGAEAEEKWRKNPYWYNGSAPYTLAVWERK